MTEARGRLGGIAAVLRRHPTAWVGGTAALVFVLLGTGAVVGGMAYGATRGDAPDPAPRAVHTQDPRPSPSGSVAASRLRTCSVAGPASNPRLMTLEAQVARADTGEVLFDRNAAAPAPTASLLKVMVAAAAIDVLGPDFQIATQVVDAGDGTIVLVGHGDATLSATAPGQESVYAGAPKLADLAAQTLGAYSSAHPDQPITRVVLDASYWTDTAWDPDVQMSERTQGYQSYTTALQVDGDRQDPTKQTSPRGTDPVADAGAAFLAALRAADTHHLVSPGVTAGPGTAPANAPQLGQVTSQPVRTLLPQMLLPSDNTLGEMLARIISKKSGLDGSASSLQQAIPRALAPFGVTTTGVVVRDGSGESPRNAVPAETLTQLMRAVQSGGQNLGVVRDALPVAGQSGSLTNRFSGSNAVARGHVTAKTGWIDTEYSMSGFMDAADGTRLVFTFYAMGTGITSGAQSALDTLATAVYSCGDNLSNN
ncbi:D-alanyl-D-alanine carboxypeptidase/D-alanyl-D-alanine endopeptidase [Pseudolysinimonas sp.]|uniref:D-alanyl-D-alanine carboxypeptidase/D-alanyl-D-alanine endopeptidase n=1 Tax=Pseudolysinimonas sp. TaxID=2680009 RepID=UPI003F7FBC01